MKNFCYLFSLFLILHSEPSLLHAQSAYPIAEEIIGLQTQQSTAFAKLPQHKAFGDTLYYEDFSDSTLGDWTIGNNSANNYDWIWSNSGPGGQYSANIGPINSPTSSNGFISMPADLYNTPALMFVPMDAYIVSKAIPIQSKTSIDLSFYQFMRYCCHPSNLLLVLVSSDSIHWDTLDPKGLLPVNAISSNPERVEFKNVANLANQDTAYLRFEMIGPYAYFWMVDDIAITEGYSNALLLDSAQIDFFPSLKESPHYTKIPLSMFCKPQLEGVARNIGAFQQTNVQMVSKVHYKSPTQSFFSQVGSNIISDTNSLNSAISTLIEKRMTQTVNSWEGSYYFSFELISDSVNQTANQAVDTSLVFEVMLDTVLARDQDNFTSAGGAISFALPGADGDKWGEYFEIDTLPFTPVASSISVYIANSPYNDGVSISPRIWQMQADTIVSIPVGSSPFSTTITSSQLGSWVTLPIFPPQSLPTGKDYVVGIEQTGGAANSKYFYLGRDQSVEKYSPPSTNFVYLNWSSTPSWYETNIFLGIRLNLQNVDISSACMLLTNVSESKMEEKRTQISPNPSNGYIKLNTKYPVEEIIVRDINGRIVHRQIVKENSPTLNLSFLKDGLYFLHFRGEVEEVHKLVIQK